MQNEVSWSELDYFIKCVLTILLGAVCYGCFNFICFVICVCFFYNAYIYCVLFVYLFLLFCSYFVVIVVLHIFIFVCTSVGLLPPGESPIAVSNNNNIKLTFYLDPNSTVTWTSKRNIAHTDFFLKKNWRYCEILIKLYS
jgi:hypothetical protein